MKVHVSHDDIMTQEEYERGEGAWNVSIARKKKRDAQEGRVRPKLQI